MSAGSSTGLLPDLILVRSGLWILLFGLTSISSSSDPSVNVNEGVTCSKLTLGLVRAEYVNTAFSDLSASIRSLVLIARILIGFLKIYQERILVTSLTSLAWVMPTIGFRIVEYWFCSVFGFLIYCDLSTFDITPTIGRTSGEWLSNFFLITSTTSNYMIGFISAICASIGPLSSSSTCAL